MTPEARARKTEWQRNQRATFKARNGYSTTANYGAGGNRAAVLARDGNACVQCGMTAEEHIGKWGRPITVDHISRDRSDNGLANLQTLCLPCHGRKDQLPELRAKKSGPMLGQMRQLRAQGNTYQQIADATGLSIGCVWKQLTKESK